MVLLISIEGNIAAGKSTLVKNLSDKLSAELNYPFVLLQEPVDIWEAIKDKDGETIIEKFYKDQQKYAFSFQMMAYISRLQILKDTIRKHPNSIIICERSIWSDRNIFAKMLADEGKIEDINLTIYQHWFDNLSKEFTHDGVIYLKTSPAVCEKRIKIRNRKGEDIPLAYLERCDQYHRKWLGDINNVDILVLSGDDPKAAVNQQWAKQIGTFVGKKYKEKYSHFDEFDIDTLHEKIHC